MAKIRPITLQSLAVQQGVQTTGIQDNTKFYIETDGYGKSVTMEELKNYLFGNSIVLGSKTNQDVGIMIYNNGSPEQNSMPGIKYNSALKTFVYSNDGQNWMQIASSSETTIIKEMVFLSPTYIKDNQKIALQLKVYNDKESNERTLVKTINTTVQEDYKLTYILRNSFPFYPLTGIEQMYQNERVSVIVNGLEQNKVYYCEATWFDQETEEVVKIEKSITNAYSITPADLQGMITVE